MRVWHVQRRALDAALLGHSDSVGALVARPDGALASAGNDRAVKVWAARALASDKGLGGPDGGRDDDGAVTEELHEECVMALAALPDGALVSAGADGVVSW